MRPGLANTQDSHATDHSFSPCTHDTVLSRHERGRFSGECEARLATAEERFHSKVPTPSQITTDLHEERPDLFVREIVVKPIPFVTVAVRQEFEVRGVEGGVALCRAEFIKL